MNNYVATYKLKNADTEHTIKFRSTFIIPQILKGIALTTIEMELGIKDKDVQILKIKIIAE